MNPNGPKFRKGLVENAGIIETNDISTQREGEIKSCK